jgi:hypothetical protein
MSVDIAQPRPAEPLVSTACATYVPGTSPHRRGVGNTLFGLNGAGIERAAHEVHRLEIGIGEEFAHVGGLVERRRRVRP